jgi:hypothetical protein
MSPLIATFVVVLLSVLFVEVLFPFVALILTLPFMEIGHRIRRLKLAMWFLSRYGIWLFESFIIIDFAFIGYNRFNISLPITLIIDVVVLFHVLAILYVFDLQHFNNMTGIWYMTCKDDV